MHCNVVYTRHCPILVFMVGCVKGVSCLHGLHKHSSNTAQHIMTNGPPHILCRVKEYRKRMGLSQEALGQLVGLRRQAVYDMEVGRYLPNTAVALRLASTLGCTVEMLFAEQPCEHSRSLTLLDESPARVLQSDAGDLAPDTKEMTGLAQTRLALAQVRDRLVGVPLNSQSGSAGSLPLALSPADGILAGDGSLHLHLPQSRLHNTALVLGCDPALSLLTGLVPGLAPGLRVHTAFASSKKALMALAAGNTHVAATHFHGPANMQALQEICPHLACLVVNFSQQEEGLMVASGNPLGIRTVADLAASPVRLVNREHGAALRRLLDSLLAEEGIPPALVQGYGREVFSHSQGALRVAKGEADAALGLRVVANIFSLGFVPLATTRCVLVVPADICELPGVAAVLESVQSPALRREMEALPGYDSGGIGNIIQRPQ